MEVVSAAVVAALTPVPSWAQNSSSLIDVLVDSVEYQQQFVDTVPKAAKIRYCGGEGGTSTNM